MELKKFWFKIKNDRKLPPGESYNFVLDAFPNNNDNSPLTNSNPLIKCYLFDEVTQICREDGMKGLFTTINLKGLYLIEAKKN